MKSGFITFLILAGVACQGAAEALQADGGETTAAPAGDGGAPPKRRGRPPGGGATAGTTGAGEGTSDADRFQRNRDLIAPLVKGGEGKDPQGDEVKKVIAKYSKTGLKDIPAANQAEFEKDIEALNY